MHQPLGGIDGFHDVVIAGAAAQIAFQPVADFVLAQTLRVLLHQVHGAHHHARRAETALQGVMFAEHLLHRVQRAIGGGQAFNGGDFGAIGLHGQHGAGFHRIAVNMHHAGAALAGVATHMGAGQAELVTQQFHQKRARFHLNR